jgi:hypothetical protein
VAEELEVAAPMPVGRADIARCRITRAAPDPYVRVDADADHALAGGRIDTPPSRGDGHLPKPAPRRRAEGDGDPPQRR